MGAAGLSNPFSGRPGTWSIDRFDYILRCTSLIGCDASHRLRKAFRNDQGGCPGGVFRGFTLFTELMDEIRILAGMVPP